MTFLSTILAFTLVMIVLSTVVSGIVEFLLRVRGTRVRVLQQMLEAYCRDVIVPSMTKDFVGSGTPGNAAQKLAQSLLYNPTVLPSLIDGKRSNRLRWLLRWFRGAETEGKLDKLSAEACVQRLAKTEYGQLLASCGSEKCAVLIKDFTLSFERYGAMSSEIFRKKAHYNSIVIAVLFAFAANIHMTNIVVFLHQNEPAREKILLQSDKIIQAYQEQSQNHQKTPPVDEKQLQQDLKNLKNQFDSVRELPFGYKFNTPDAPSAKNGDFWSTIILSGMSWFVNVLAAGLLIGLGGPFWFRAFNSLSQISQILGISIGGSRETVSTQAKQTETVEPDAELNRYVELFRIAAQLPATAKEESDEFDQVAAG